MGVAFGAWDMISKVRARGFILTTKAQTVRFDRGMKELP